LYCLLCTIIICLSPHLYCILWIVTIIVYGHSEYILVINSDIYELLVKYNDPRNSAICIEWVDSNKDWRIWGFWYSRGLYLL
jgi:hypothetical protein